MVATEEEITRGIETDDAARTTRRAAAATRVGELARQRAAVVEQLNDIERQLGEVLAESSDVIELDELARYTKVNAADLTRWLNDRKPTRTRRRRSADSPGGRSGLAGTPRSQASAQPAAVQPDSAVSSGRASANVA